MLLFVLFACQESIEDTSLPNKDDTAIIVKEVHPCFQESPTVIIGEGATEFEPFNEHLEAMMIHGPQGGWHIEVALALENMLQVLEIAYTIEHIPSGVFVSENNYRIAMVMKGDCSGEMPGLYGYLSVVDLMEGDVDTPPEILAGDLLEITIRVNDCSNSAKEDGFCIPEERWVEETLVVTATLDPQDQITEE